jgi:hypothetical protein
MGDFVFHYYSGLSKHTGCHSIIGTLLNSSIILGEQFLDSPFWASSSDLDFS